MHLPLHQFHQNPYSHAGNGTVPAVHLNAALLTLKALHQPLAMDPLGTVLPLLQQGPMQECTVMGGTFDYAVQMLLFIICMGSLLLKWHIERPQRRLFVFFLDTSKQLAAAALFHLINLIFAIVADSIITTTDQCAWYWVNLMFDNTFGLFITYLFVRGSEWGCGYASGMYGEDGVQIDWDNKPDYNNWARQILIYCGITMSAKALSMTIVILCASSFAAIGGWGTNWINNAQMRLLWVMIVTPAFMNTFYFWTADEFLRAEVSEDIVEPSQTRKTAVECADQLKGLCASARESKDSSRSPRGAGEGFPRSS